jgi:hypothetical protein
VNLNSVTDTHLLGVGVFDVSRRPIVATQGLVDKEACVAFCSYWEPNQCSESSIKDSIAAGCAFAGFVAPGDECDDNSNAKFYNNVAHSNERVGGHIYPDPAERKSGRCYKGSHFAAYKNRECGVSTMYRVSEEMRMEHLTMIDNVLGISLNSAGESDDVLVSMNNVEIYGETKAEDCPQD